MNPGPEPREAIREAIKKAIARGTALDRDLLLEAQFRFILFCAGLTVFVLVKRTRVHITSPEDCAAEYWRDILRLRRVPLTGVVAREIWLLNPWGTWQYFRILDDRVIEIRADGTPLMKESVKVPAPAPAPITEPAPAPVLASVPAPIPEPAPDPVLDFVPDSTMDSAPDSAPVPDMAGRPGLSPLEPAPSSDEGR